MDNLFKAAICSQCSGPLDVNKLHCPACGTNFVIDWNQAVVAAVPPSTRWRDQKVDAILIAALQYEALRQNVEVALLLKEGQNENHLVVLVKDKEFNNWEEAGCFTGYATNNGFSYRIFGGGSYDSNRRDYRLEWHQEYGQKTRFYQVRDSICRAYYHGNSYNLRGEQELFDSQLIKLLMNVIVAQAYRRVRSNQAKATSGAKLFKIRR